MPTAEDDPLLVLFQMVRPRLDEDTRNRLGDDADALQDLLSVEGCGLTWAELRRIRKYTVNFNPAVEELRMPSALEGEQKPALPVE